jgi:hypothetical protein
VTGTNGQPVVYSFIVLNDGDVTLTNVTLIDADITPAFTNVLGSLAAGQSVTVTVNSVISADLTNTASVTGQDPVGNTHEDSDDAVVLQVMYIAGSVFLDVNANGLFDPEDTNGLAGAVITLRDASSNIVGVVTTAVDGAYIFTGLTPGGYFVTETDPAGFFSTGDVDGPNDNRIDVTLVSGIDSTGNDFLDADEAEPRMTKVFVSASDVDADGNFTATYNIIVDNSAFSAGWYNLIDTPKPDTNVTVNGATISGYTNLAFPNDPGPYVLATNEFIPARSTNIYVVVLDLTLSPDVMGGFTNVSFCGGTNGIFEAGEGLFNEATAFGFSGTNFVTITTNDCGNIPPVITLEKDFVSATEPDANGDFTAFYTITVTNSGGSTGTYDLTDDPQPDTNITVNGAVVTGQVSTNFTGAGVYAIADDESIPARGSHTYLLAVSMTLEPQVLNGSVSVSLCAESQTGFVSGRGLFNEAVVTYGDFLVSVTNDACGEVPPFLLLDKAFVSATELDQNGDFSATYTITVRNVGGTAGTYDLDDTPAPDTNVTVNGAAVSGQITTNYTGAGPYELASGTSIGVGATHTYTLVLSLTLEDPVLSGAVSVTLCEEGSSGFEANNGLFNEVTLVYGTNDTTLTTNDCGEIPPFLLIDKTFVSATQPDSNGVFAITYTITVDNVGGTAGTYDLSDDPQPDTNVTITAAAVSGQITTNFTGGGAYALADDEVIPAGGSHTYTLVLDAQLSMAVMEGTSFVSLCGSGGQGQQAGEGLFNEVTITYGTNNTSITTNDCGNIPPVLTVHKTFLDASEPDTNGLFTATYQIRVENTGGVPDIYDLIDQPFFDTNITVVSAGVTGHITNNYAGAGPYTLVTDETIAAGGIHTYLLAVTAQLETQVLDGSVSVSLCGVGQAAPVAGEGLFNLATLRAGTNNVETTDEDCGDVPPFMIIDKVFVDASEADTNGNFSVTYQVVVKNLGGTASQYDLEDTPGFDTNVTVLGGAVSGQLTTNLTGAGPYQLATAEPIAAGATHTYTITLDAQLSLAVISGIIEVSECGETTGTATFGEGLFNEVELAYRTNGTTTVTNDCGNIPPFLLLDKTFVSATEPDQDGNFSATYTITVRNVGGTAGTYDLDDTPAPDTNVTVNSAAVSGQITTNYTGAGPYELASGTAIGVGATHSYTLVVSLTLQDQVLSGAVSVSLCEEGQSGFEANNGLFNEVTLVYGTNDVTLTTNDCGEIPPFMLLDKVAVDATEPDANGNFTATYTITVVNVGGTATDYDLSDLPQPDTNVTVNGVAVSGQITTNFTGAGPYELASNTVIGAGATHTYTLVLDLTLQDQVLNGSVTVSVCYESEVFLPGNGLYNEATLVYGPSNKVLEAEDCLDVPPFLLIDKTFVDATEPDANGNFVVTYDVTVWNVGGSPGI